MFAMPRGKNRTLQDIENFLRKKLRVKLRRDPLSLRIVKEADVECAVYHHLRRYAGEDPRWRVLARKHVPITRYYVDLLIFKKYRPVVAMELKWGQSTIGKKDRKSLNGALTKLGVNKAYWLSATTSEKKGAPLVKETVERHMLHSIVVRLGFNGRELENWKTRRKQLRSDMICGRGRKLVF